MQNAKCKMQNAKLQLKIQNSKKIKKELPSVQKNISLKNYTTFKIGGKAKYFFAAKSKESLISAIKAAKRINLPFFMLGRGSNLLVSDKEYKGLIIKIQNTKYKIPRSRTSSLRGKQNTKIYAEAGVPLSQLLNEATKNNLTGLEWAVGIPGSVGGAVKGNAGAFGSSLSDNIQRVEVFNINNEKIKIFKNKNCQFSYRNSIFKKNKSLIVVSLVLKLKKGDKKEMEKKIKEYSDYRKRHQPLNFSSAGSIFVNPEGFSAGQLIEKCGLKGKKIGEAQISKIHANFIVNRNRAKAKDVKKLINLMKKKVKQKFGLVLKEEIEYL